MQRGDTYKGKASVESVATVIEEESALRGLVTRREVSEAGELLIQAAQSAEWYWVLLKALPQNVRWTVRRLNEETHISVKSRLFRWYLAIVVGVSVLIPLLLWLLSSTTPAFSQNLSASVSLVVVSILLLPVLILIVPHLIGGRATDILWEAVRSRIETTEGFLDPVSSRTGIYGSRRLFVYLAFVVLMVIVFLGPGLWRAVVSGASSGDNLLRYLIVCAALLGCTILVMLSTKAATLRVVPLLPGLSGGMAMLILIGAQVPWILLFGRDTKAVSHLQEMQAQLTEFEDSLRGSGVDAESKAEAETMVAEIRRSIQTISLFPIACSVLFVVWAILQFLGTVRLAILAWASSWRLKAHRKHRSVRKALSGSGFLTRFRVILTGVWVAVAGLAVLGMLSLTSLGLSAVLGNRMIADPLEINRAVTGSIMFAAWSFGGVSVGPLLQITVRACWTVYCGFGLSIFVFSVASLCWQRRRTLRHLEANIRKNDAGRKLLSRMLQALCTRGNVVCPEVSVSESYMPYATAYVFGFFHKRRFIEVSSRCLEWQDDEIEALLAHELSHHLNGHCVLDNLFRLLGRLTLVGEGFVQGLEDSFGYEMSADRFAVEKLHVGRKALKHCLWKMCHVGSAEGAGAQDIQAGLAATSFPEDHFHRLLIHGPDILPFRVRWRLAWQLFVRQYAGLGRASYWHPATEERIKALEA